MKRLIVYLADWNWLVCDLSLPPSLSTYHSWFIQCMPGAGVACVWHDTCCLRSLLLELRSGVMFTVFRWNRNAFVGKVHLDVEVMRSCTDLAHSSVKQKGGKNRTTKETKFHKQRAGMIAIMLWQWSNPAGLRLLPLPGSSRWYRMWHQMLVPVPQLLPEQLSELPGPCT